MYVNYSLTAHNSSSRRDIVADAVFQVIGHGQGDQLIFKRKARFQGFADIRERLLELEVVIVIDSVFEAGVVIIHNLLGVGFQLWIEPGGGQKWRIAFHFPDNTFINTKMTG